MEANRLQNRLSFGGTGRNFKRLELSWDNIENILKEKWRLQLKSFSERCIHERINLSVENN